MFHSQSDWPAWVLGKAVVSNLDGRQTSPQPHDHTAALFLSCQIMSELKSLLDAGTKKIYIYILLLLNSSDT